MFAEVRRRRVILAMAGVLVIGVPASVSAADKFPSRPITIIVPVGPGSAIDSGTRILAKVLATQLSSPVIVQNKPGADTLIGTQALLNAPADGHTVLVIGLTNMVISPLTNDKLPYEPLRDIRPVARLSTGSSALIVSAESKYKTLPDLLAAARENPGAVSFGNNTTFYKLGNVRFERAANVQFNHISYSGGGAVTTAVAGGVVDAAFLDASAVVPLVNAGKLRVLATSGTERNNLLPHARTVKEQGIDFTQVVWIGLGVRSGTPHALVKELESVFRKAVLSDEYREFVTGPLGGVLSYADGAQMAAQIRNEAELYRPVVKSLNFNAR